MSPLTTKVALGSEARGEGVSWSRLTTMGTNVEWTILSIVTEIMTLKAFSESRCGLMTDGDVTNSIGSGEDSHFIGERLEKGPVESEDFLIDSSILKLRFHRGRRGSTSRGRGRRESRQECGWGGHSF